jgi:hypothetical protein
VPADIPSDNTSLRDAVRTAQSQPDALAALTDLYQQLDTTLADSDARCLGGGTCCRFDLAGHRLYVTTLELALFMRQPPTGPIVPLRCPYQRGPHCHARTVRSLGCRTYFCRSPELTDLYETYHQAIAHLHDQYAIPYLYVELTSGLAACTPDAG